MIVVDTSALIAILQEEEQGNKCLQALEAEVEILISAGTVAEALIVAAGRKMSRQLTRLLEEFGFEIVPVTAAGARRIGAIYAKWGKGVHPAGLNMGDCFAYEVAQERSCPLLFVGDDFAKTDLQSVL
jgi:ribonuclease VapC